ncbi:DUF3618 domain-containing protein [Desulfocurvibacter africanus]|uniref:DUF3618 domain-containing protein n=1 Tax=Desulfocurvibacter africanus TaxID=873 RepID=UPI00040B97A8|nr:DUF3618 domain-containing protein [Desulfocurvibacter africanus]
MAQEPSELTRARQAGNHKRDPDEIMADIRRARAEMSVTAGEVRTRLDPERLKAQAKEQVREATVGRAKNMAENMSMKAKGYSRSMKERIKDNPIPAAMTAIGIGWLMWGSREKAREERHGYDYGYMVSSQGLRSDYPERMETTASPCGTVGIYSSMATGRPAEQERAGARIGETAQEYRERMGEKAQEMREQMGEKAHEYRERLSETAEEYRARMSDKAGQYRESARRYYESGRERAAHAGQSLHSRYEHNPLGMGLAVMAAGALAGLAFKESRWEHETMGPYRDKMLSSVQEAGSERLHHAAEKATEKVHEARERMEAKAGEAESRMSAESGTSTSAEWRGASSPGVGHPTVGDTRPRSENMAQEEPAPMDKPSKLRPT